MPKFDDPARQRLRGRPSELIAEKGHMAWQKAAGHGRRSAAETAISRHEHLAGSKLRARSLPGQQGKVILRFTRSTV